MKLEDQLYAALENLDIGLVKETLNRGANPCALCSSGKLSLIEYAATLGFVPAVELMHKKALACAHQNTANTTSYNLSSPGNPYGEERPSCLFAAAASGNPGSLAALSVLDITFDDHAFSGVLYKVLETKSSSQYQPCFREINDFLIFRQARPPLLTCVRSLLSPRIGAYPRSAWECMLEIGWVEPREMLKISRDKTEMNRLATTIFLANDSGKVEHHHLLERLGWLCHAGFDLDPLVSAMKTRQYQESHQDALLISMVHALSQKAKLERNAPPVSNSTSVSPGPRM